MRSTSSTRYRASVPGLTELNELLPRVLSGADLATFQARREQYRAAKVPDALSLRIASLAALRSAPDLVEIAERTRLSIEAVANVYFGVCAAMSLDWIRERIEALGVDGHWQAVARGTLRDNIYDMQRTLSLQVLTDGKRLKPAKALDAWLARKSAAVEHVRTTVNEMRSLPTADFATLSVALQAVRRATEP